MKCGTWWPISKFANPERTDGIYTDLKSWKRLSKKTENYHKWDDRCFRWPNPSTDSPQKFSVYLLLMECKMITYTKSPMHSLAKWWLWSSPEQSFQVELKDITDGDATRIMQSKYWLKPKLGETYVRFLNTVIHTVRFYQKYWHFHKLCERSELEQFSVIWLNFPN